MPPATASWANVSMASCSRQASRSRRADRCGPPSKANKTVRERDTSEAMTNDTRGHRIYASPDMAAWLDSRKSSLALTTMQSGHLLFLAGDGAGKLLAGGRAFDFPRGLSLDDAHLW